MVKKILKYSAIALVTIFILLFGALYYVESYINPDVDQLFSENRVPYKIRYISIDSDSIRIIESGNFMAEHLVLFIHGAPGSWADFSSYFTDSTLTNQAILVGFDRPGYGKSVIEGDMPSISYQVELAEEILSLFDKQEITVVGYSYGGPIAGILAARNPHLVNNLLLLAPVVHPDHEPIFWFNYLIDIPFVAAILPEYIVRANEEKLNHARDLKEIRTEWEKVVANTIHMHCHDDWIAPFEPNTTFIKDNIKSNSFQLIDWTGDNHFLPNRIRGRILPVLSEMVVNIDK